MAENPIQILHKLGQSIWYDNIQRHLLENGDLAGMIKREEIFGITSNPSIFQNAIANSSDYDAALKPMAWSGWKAEEIFFQLAIEDIKAAALLFLPIYEKTKKIDGYVSLEVNPLLAHKTKATIEQAKSLWEKVGYPNLMIKIPATPESIPAIQEVIAAGINVNVTLIFSVDRYAEVINAFLSGLEKRVKSGQPVDSIASVASFFVSRMDTKVDPKLTSLITEGKLDKKLLNGLLGKAAIANTYLAYELFKNNFSSERFKKLRSRGAQVQRPLWASTSVKNPAYRDVLYIEELIATDTVNTVPPKTLQAFLDHGSAQLSLEEKGKGSQKVINDLKSVGISIEQVTKELEDEGVQAFSNSFKDLFKTIDQRSRLARKELGTLKNSVQDQVNKLENASVIKRIFDGDPTLWTLDTSFHAEIRARIGWLDSPEKSKEMLPELKVLLNYVQQHGFTNALLLGMGGSSLAPEVFSLTFGVREITGALGLELNILDSTDPDQVKAVAKISPPEKTLYIISSKSGSTSEVSAYLDYFWAICNKRLKSKAAYHFVAITDPGSSLEILARQRGFKHVFLADPNVGGRYSVLIAFGLVPACILGLDVSRLLKHADWMEKQCRPDNPSGRNPGLVLGAIIGAAAEQGKDKLTILTDPELSSFGSWLEQLVAESSGKQGKGIVPVDIEPKDRPSHYSKDRLFVYMKKSGQAEKFVQSLLRSGHSVITIDVLDEYDIGAEFYRWEMATSVACSILGVNAFNQPDVQDSKNRTSEKIAFYRKSGQFNEGIPTKIVDGCKVYSNRVPGLEKAADIKQIVSIFLESVKDGDYIAINAYLPRNPRNLAKLQKLRTYILKHTGKATTLGFGPRFLHSTGQLHKGGADNGIFLQITANPKSDMEIPEQGITFGTLERAQALGDLEALIGRNRRVIRINLDGKDITDLIPSKD